MVVSTDALVDVVVALSDDAVEVVLDPVPDGIAVVVGYVKLNYIYNFNMKNDIIYNEIYGYYGTSINIIILDTVQGM